VNLEEIANHFDAKILSFLSEIRERLGEWGIFSKEPFRMWNEGFSWWMVVYPADEEEDTPNEALDVKFRLSLYYDKREETTTRVKFSLNLDTAGGTPVDEVSYGEFVDTIGGLRGQFEEFDNDWYQVALRIRAYIVKVRENYPQDPREWSPRWNLGAKRKGEEPVRVNIVEEEEWKENWTGDSTDFDERLQNLGDEHYQTIMDTKGQCRELIEDILGKFYDRTVSEDPREWSPRTGPVEVGPEGVRKICNGLHDGKLEGVSAIIRDTIHYMYEEALMPNDGDIKYAIEETQNKFVNDPELDYEIWDPLIDLKVERWKDSSARVERGIMLDLMNQIHFTREEGHYDRYIEFGFMDTQSVKDVIYAWPIGDREWVRDALRFQEFKNLKNQFMGDFFEKLKKDMRESDPENRRDWRGQWKAMLKDEPRMQAARREIWEYLRTAPELPEEDEE